MDPHAEAILQIVRSPEYAGQLVKVYRGAADRIETRGLAQHDPVDERGAVCLVQSLTEATDAVIGHRPYSRSGSWLCSACYTLAIWIVGEPLTLARWNDQPGRTAQEVVKHLRGLADFLSYTFHV